jgi:uncharacterized membrane protein HdeD (DUF308 family)
MKPISRTGRILILSMFAFVLLLTGSVVLNMYATSLQDRQAEWQFHFITGLFSVITGVVCVAGVVWTIMQTQTVVKFQTAWKESAINRQPDM